MQGKHDIMFLAELRLNAAQQAAFVQRFARAKYQEFVSAVVVTEKGGMSAGVALLVRLPAIAEPLPVVLAEHPIFRQYPGRFTAALVPCQKRSHTVPFASVYLYAEHLAPRNRAMLVHIATFMHHCRRL